MPRFRRFCTLCLAVLAVFALVPGRALATDPVYFTALNERVLDLTDETMPFWYGGQLYVPYTDEFKTELGFSYGRSSDGRRILLVKMRKVLVCDFGEDRIYDNGNTGTTLGAPLLRGERVFLPVEVLCRFFSLEYSYSLVNDGYLLRIKSDEVVLTDEIFIDAARSLLASRYAQYERTHRPPPDVTPPTPVDPTPQPPVAKRTLYLVIDGSDNAVSQRVIDELAASGDRATFLFPNGALADSGDLLRRIAAAGFAVALEVDASGGAEAALAAIEEGNRLLWAASNGKTRLVHLADASEETAAAVAAAGYCPLRFTAEYDPDQVTGARILAAADAHGGSCCVYIDAEAAGTSAFSALRYLLKNGNGTLHKLTELAAQRLQFV